LPKREIKDYIFFLKTDFGSFSPQNWGKEKKNKNHQILIFGSHCVPKQIKG
jgi:hypothetical protein